MLTELRIRNLAIIEDLQLTFSGGLNLLTGETGAGKSIIVEALSLLTGARADAGCVRAGARAALLEARFALAPDCALGACEAAGVEFDPGEPELLLAREIGADGRSRCWINGRASTLAVLRETGEQLADLHGQHQAQTLLRAATHREALDRFAAHLPLRERVGAAATAVRETAAALERARGAESDRAERLELLSFQHGELAAFAPVPGEDLALAEEERRLRHGARIAELGEALVQELSESDDALLARLARAEHWLGELAGLDPRTGEACDRLAEARLALEEAVRAVRPACEVELDPPRLELIASRLAQLQALVRKYGGDSAALAARAARTAGELAELQNLGARLDALEADLAVARRAYAELAGELTASRLRAARALEQELRAELRSLGMPSADVVVAVTPLPGAGSEADGNVAGHGVDEVEILVSANAGEAPRPLVRTASGGELSRIMLALNVVLGRAAGLAPTIVFDEVDAGIGGRTADLVGSRLAALGRDRQVLCVTHLPQIASRATLHWQITKAESGGRTLVAAAALDERGRIEELARMMSGQQLGDVALRHARELLAAARAEQAPAAPAVSNPSRSRAAHSGAANPPRARRARSL